MAEECTYYYYEGGYCCALKKEKEDQSSIDKDTVDKYCWGYHYEDCPRYKDKNSSSGGCFITSACVEARGLADDCKELTILRSFRDTYLRNVEGGMLEISQYYLIAPKIVEKIKAREDSMTIFERIYSELVEPCVAFIEQGENGKAHELYKKYTLRLSQELV